MIWRPVFLNKATERNEYLPHRGIALESAKPLLDKEYWRAHAKTIRRQMAPAERAAAAEKVRDFLLNNPAVQRAKIISLYASFGPELRTHELIHELLRAGKTLALPRIVHWRKVIEMHAIDRFPDGFDSGDFGIFEPNPTAFPRIVQPSEMDLVFVPALIFDRAHYRIGYGAGYYDRLLSLPHQAKTVGLAYQCQIIEKFEHDPWDKPVDAICTEAGLVAGDTLD